MSRQFDDYFDNIPEPFKNQYYDCDYDLDADDVEWAVIREFPDYCVSKYGEVCSARSKGFRIIRTWTNQHGHQYVQLHNGNVHKKCLVHRLVAEAFIPNPKQLPMVRHLDDDPSNNYYKNLAWGTAKDNRDDCVRNGHEHVIPVYCYELDRTFRSCAEAADYFNVERSLITVCCSGKINSIKGGYHLCYLDDLEEKMKDKDRWLWRAGNMRHVKAINITTGEERIYRSRQEASADLGIADSYISNIIAGRSPRQTRGWTFEDWEGVYG